MRDGDRALGQRMSEMETSIYRKMEALLACQCVLVFVY